MTAPPISDFRSAASSLPFMSAATRGTGLLKAARTENLEGGSSLFVFALTDGSRDGP
jgi:hypothetical protein